MADWKTVAYPIAPLFLRTHFRRSLSLGMRAVFVFKAERTRGKDGTKMMNRNWKLLGLWLALALLCACPGV